MLVSIIIAGLVMGAIYGMVGLGYSVIFRASGIMNLAQGEMVTLASLIGVTLYQTLGLSFWVTLALTMVIMFSSAHCCRWVSSPASMSTVLRASTWYWSPWASARL